MEADKRRKIRDGREFDHLFPAPDLRDSSIKAIAGLEDTMALMKRTVPETLWQTKKIASELKGRGLEETCSNIWHFVYGHIQYRRDKDGVEQIRSPRRTWWERKTGVDCDCYTEFISSILTNLNIPHKARVTKYPKPPPQVPRWQHVYPVVPKDGRVDKELNSRDDYIVLDCVKDDFDDEQPYLAFKDYDMRLEYLDGFEDDENTFEEQDYGQHENVDLSDLASYYDDEEMGSIFKKIGKAVKSVGTAVKTTVKKVGDKVGDGVRFLNRYTNPATILLRNGFLLCMKINLMNVAGKLRYAYLSDADAQARGMNMSELSKLRTIKDRAETVYWQAGGKKENLKKAILNGRGNKDKKVSLSGLAGWDDNEYADLDEYNIIHNESVDGLGEIASGTAIAAATSAVTAIATALKGVKGLFSKGGSEEQSFQSDTDNAGNASVAPATMSEEEDAFVYEDNSPVPTPPYVPAPMPMSIPNKSNETSNYPATGDQTAKPVLPSGSATARNLPATAANENAGSNTPAENSSQSGVFQKASTWVKLNPGKSLLVGGVIATGGFLLFKAMKSPAKSRSSGGLDGLPSRTRRSKKHKAKRHQSRRKRRTGHVGRRKKIIPTNLL